MSGVDPMNVPRPTPQTQAISSGEDARVLSISKPSPKIIADFTKEAAPAAPPSKDRDSFAVTAIADLTDRSLHAAAARFTGGLSPAALAQAYLDWATHLANAPGKRMQLVDKAVRKAVRFANYAGRCAAQGGKAECCIEPLPQDRRFAGDGWHRWPYNLIHQAFLLNQQWWHNATTGVRGISRQHENIVEFTSRQILDMFSPSNFLLTNPEALRTTAAKGSMDLVNGLKNLAEDWERDISGKSRSAPKSSWSAATSPSPPAR
jgi:polyhydroxyalkanoate synthase subunit PhaC